MDLWLPPHDFIAAVELIGYHSTSSRFVKDLGATGFSKVYFLYLVGIRL
jgi:hypothetical protein